MSVEFLEELVSSRIFSSSFRTGEVQIEIISNQNVSETEPVQLLPNETLPVFNAYYNEGAWFPNYKHPLSGIM